MKKHKQEWTDIPELVLLVIAAAGAVGGLMVSVSGILIALFRGRNNF